MQTVRENLLDAGCAEASAQTVEQMMTAGRFEDALHRMRVLRCDLVDELHRSQRRVDCIDHLIRQTEKEIKNKAERR